MLSFQNLTLAFIIALPGISKASDRSFASLSGVIAINFTVQIFWHQPIPYLSAL